MTTFDPEKITFFAKTDARGQEATFGIKAKDRQRHMYVIGKTGMGKSTLLENMAAQDIQNGEGMAFIDPHGSTAEALLEYVPEHRVKDVVYFAPFDLDNPVSFNVMEDVGPDKRHLVVSGLMSTFKKIWVDQWSARMEYILTNALLVLIEYPDTTLLSVNRLFSDKAYRNKVIDYCKDPAVKSFWIDEFNKYTERFAAEALPAIQNKIGQFTGNPLIRNIVGQPHSSFDIRQIMDEKKILIMNLSKGLIGETNANLLGSMLTTRIYLAAMSRANLPLEEMRQMPNFYFYVDEFQSFANATFADILSEARKYHLNLIIAHQYIEQMEEEVKNAVFGNVGTTIAFRVGPFDAEVLETVYAPRFEATDLVNLGFAQIYLTLMIDGIGSQPFSAKTLAPIELPRVSCRGMVVDASRSSYAKDRATVEKIVADLHTPHQEERPKKPSDKRPNQAKPSSYQGNKKPTNVTTQNQPKFNSSPPRENVVKKPVVKQTTPEDLRQVLSKMSQAENSDKKETQAAVVKRTVPNKPKEINQKPAAKVDLKGALADVLKKAEAQKQSTEIKPPTNTPEQIKKNTEPQVPHKSVQTERSERPLSNENQTKREADRKPASIISTPPRLQNQSEPKSQIRKVVIEHRQRRQINTSQPQQKIIENNPQKPNRQKVENNSVDANQIKRMLRQSDNERSPFK